MICATIRANARGAEEAARSLCLFTKKIRTDRLDGYKGESDAFSLFFLFRPVFLVN